MSEIPLTVQEAAQQLRSGDITAVALTEAVIERAARLDADIGSYLLRFDDTALVAAATADRELADGVDRGPLHGIPVGVKDILAAVEGPTTAQSLVLDPAWGAGKDAPIVRRLRDAGAVITGKTSTMEFAIGMPDSTKPFPLPRNPWDLATWPGGSSSGTGSGVAAGFFLAGIGTDTGGSIRIPAAFCGVSGLMPTFSRVPKSGCTPLGYSLDHIGPLARSAWDCGAMLGVLAGHDPSDPDSSTRPVPNYLEGLGSIAGLRVGVVRESHFDNASADAVSAYERAVAVLGDLGAVVTDVVLPLYPEVNAAAMVTMGAEACAYHHNDLASRWGDYFARTRSIVAWGALISGADFVQAQRVRRAGQKLLQQLFAEVDVLVTPTAITGGPTYDFIDNEDIFAFMGMIHTSYWDAMGNPALVVPMGFTDSGMPLSMQLAGRPFDEATLVRLGDAFQTVTDWHRSVPAYAADPVAA